MSLAAHRLTLLLQCSTERLPKTPSKLAARDVLPNYLSTKDAYRDEPYVYSAFGTNCHGHHILYPRKSMRLVVCRPKKPLKKHIPVSRKKIHWPDAQNAQDVAMFYEKQLEGGGESQEVPVHVLNLRLDNIRSIPDARSPKAGTHFDSINPFECDVTLSAIPSAKIVSMKNSLSKRWSREGTAPAVKSSLRFARGMNEA